MAEAGGRPGWRRRAVGRSRRKRVWRAMGRESCGERVSEYEGALHARALRKTSCSDKRIFCQLYTRAWRRWMASTCGRSQVNVPESQAERGLPRICGGPEKRTAGAGAMGRRDFDIDDATAPSAHDNCASSTPPPPASRPTAESWPPDVRPARRRCRPRRLLSLPAQRLPSRRRNGSPWPTF